MSEDFCNSVVYNQVSFTQPRVKPNNYQIKCKCDNYCSIVLDLTQNQEGTGKMDFNVYIYVCVNAFHLQQNNGFL